jgi:hypothetical protein
MVVVTQSSFQRAGAKFWHGAEAGYVYGNSPFLHPRGAKWAAWSNITVF